MNDATRLLLITGLGLAAMIGAILGLQRSVGLRVGLQPMVAALRAVIQLAGLALILQGVFTYPWLAVAMLAVMMTVASLTSGRRLKILPYGTRAAAVGIVAAASATIAIIFVLQLMPLTVSNFIAIGGIITGNSMSAATLTGRRFLASSQTQRGEIEAWFALGARPRRAFAQVSRTAIEEMLLPTIDQTKSTGLVTMPGAFVGALIGGASPVEAARFQVVVLVAIMLAQTICGIIVTRILSRATVVVSEQGSVVGADETSPDAQADLESRARRHTAKEST
ncbi:ABC transporter permease [Trueperella pyogenes]|uniref:ABC transporter permease n=1 Tax=Trueperella pyogenes TaxID=1661 RepID=UPI00345C71BA